MFIVSGVRRGTATMRWNEIGWNVARCLFGLCLIGLTLSVVIQFDGNHPPEAVEAAADLTGALNRSGFMNPLLIISLLTGGAALMVDRSSPIGLLLVAPAITVIALFHYFLTGSYVWGSIWPIWWAALAWHYRHVFARLWQPSGD